MSKLKIIDMNKQLIDKSKQTVARMESLQTSVQSHLGTLKRIEADLIKVVRAEAEEKRARQQQEELEQQREAEMRAAQEARAATEMRAAEEDRALKARQVAAEKAQQPVQPPVVEAKPVAETIPVIPVPTESPKAKPPVAAESAESIQKSSDNKPVVSNAEAHETTVPVVEQSRPQETRQYPQDNRPPRQDQPYSQDNRPPRQDRPYSQDNRPPRQDRPYSQDNRPPRQDRPYSQDNRPPRQDRPYSQDNRPPRQDRPYSQDNRPPRQDRPYSQDNRPPRQDGRPAPGKRLPGAKAPESDLAFVPVEKRNIPAKKTQTGTSFAKDDKNRKSKKALMKERVTGEDDERYRGKRRVKAIKSIAQPMPVVIDKVVMNTETISVKTLAEKTGKPVAELIKKLLLLGMMCTINSEIDYDTAQLICTEFNIELEYKLDKTAEDVLDEGDQVDTEENLVTRPPIVTVMGHVDHGKTSLLDAIRLTRVTEHEAGGITQHIGAYTITHNDRKITFLDTPGHEAFTAMRARGAQVTDIAILVVAADDGVMPQTVEAINHAKAAGVPIIVAINKIDKENANPERIKQDLTEYGLVAEEWGGETIMAPVSAITKEGIENLLEMVLLVADVQELKANPNRLAKGTIIEAKLDKGRGPVATVLVQNGTLRISDMIVAGVAYGRVRAMNDDMGNRVDEAYPSQPVEVVGFSEVPVAGDILHAVEQDKLTRQVAEERKDKQKADQLKSLSKVSLEDLFSQVESGKVKDLNIVIKADVQGSVEAVKQALEKLSNSEVRVKVIHAGVGAIKAMDVMLASASNAIIIGFNVRPDSIARAEADKEKVEIRLYRIIYKAIEDLELAIKGMLAPQFKEVVLGHAEVRNIFTVSSVGTIAGSYVTDGKLVRNASVRLLRDNVVVHEGQMASLKRFKDDAKEVAQGYECGITLKNYNDIKEGDVIEAFEMQEIER
jgi:translation initiation factor IF-2